MKIKLYSARELDKKFPSGKWNGINVIERHGNKTRWKYCDIYRDDYKKLARKWHTWTNYFAVYNNDNLDELLTQYEIESGYRIPKIFVKKKAK